MLRKRSICVLCAIFMVLILFPVLQVAAAGTTIVDDNNASVTYNGTWSALSNDSTYYGSTCHYGNTANGYIQYTFTGTGVEWYGLKNIDLGMADVYIDNVLKGSSIDCYSTTRAVNMLFSISDLTSGSHTIKKGGFIIG